MSRLRRVLPVALFVGMLSARKDMFGLVESRLEDKLGPIGQTSNIMPFNFTDYYRREMGEAVWRKFVSFERLIEPDMLAPVKVFTNRLEEDFRAGQSSVKRPINLDPGYICGGKLVLASAKDYAHRIYLGDGIYAEVSLRYIGNRFESLPWTYPDYKTAEYQEFFIRVRSLYMNKLKSSACKSSSGSSSGEMGSQ